MSRRYEFYAGCREWMWTAADRRNGQKKTGKKIKSGMEQWGRAEKKRRGGTYGLLRILHRN